VEKGRDISTGGGRFKGINFGGREGWLKGKKKKWETPRRAPESFYRRGGALVLEGLQPFPSRV